MGLNYSGYQKSLGGILIPTVIPRLVNFPDPSHETTKELRFVWYQEDKEFLQYNPQLWLYRYNGNIKKSGTNPAKRWKGYRHPSNNLPSSTNQKWWGGAHYYATGAAIPSRATEFSLNTIEGNETLLTGFQASLWMAARQYPPNANTPLPLPHTNVEDVHPTGRKSYAPIRHYFKFAIVIDNPSGVSADGHGKLFGPLCSETLVLGVSKGNPPGSPQPTANRYQWMINQNFIRGFA